MSVLKDKVSCTHTSRLSYNSTVTNLILHKRDGISKRKSFPVQDDLLSSHSSS